MWKKCKKWVIEAFFPTKCIISGENGTWMKNELKNFPPAPINRAKFKYLDEIIACTHYQDPVVEKLLHEFKFKFNANLGEILAEEMAKKLPRDTEKFLLPIPLSWQRKLWRGWNQSVIIANEIARKNSKVIVIYNLQNIFWNRRKQQSSLNLSERKLNLKNIFIWKKNNNWFERNFPGKNKESKVPEKIYLIDDVVSSGSTLDEAARICKLAGVKKVVGLVFARSKS